MVADASHESAAGCLAGLDRRRALGAAILVNGRPNRGCATGANDLGHTRFFVETARCFCGYTGCVERIVSTPFLSRQDELFAKPKSSLSLIERAERFGALGDDPSLDEVIKYLTCSLANAVNFVRPHRLVLVSNFTRFPAFGDTLLRLTRAMVLPQLADRVQLDLWDEPGAGSAETAAWLAMAELLWGGWNQSEITPAQRLDVLSRAASSISGESAELPQGDLVRAAGRTVRPSSIESKEFCPLICLAQYQIANNLRSEQIALQTLKMKSGPA